MGLLWPRKRRNFLDRILVHVSTSYSVLNFVDAKPGKIHRARRRVSEIKTDSVRIFHWVKQDDDWLIEDAISLCR